MPNEPELTDSDLAEIERLMHHARGPSLRQAVLYGLAAGYRRGIEDAAKVCENMVAIAMDEAANQDNAYGARLVHESAAMARCAAAIRALAK